MTEFLQLLKAVLEGGSNNDLLLALLFAFGSYLLFEHLEGILSNAAKAQLGHALKTLNLRRLVSESPDLFLTIADKIFGPRLFSIRAFITSSLISVSLLCAFILLFFIHYRLDPKIYLHLIAVADLPSVPLAYRVFWNNFAIFSLIGLTNIFIDFLSLVATRAIIQTIRARGSALLVFLLLCLDLAVSYLIFLIPTSAIASIWMTQSTLSSMQWDQFPFLIQIPHSIGNQGINGGDLLVDWYNLCIASSMFTSLLTSAWLWVFVAASVLAWLAQKLVPTLQFAKWALDVERQPLRSMSIFAAVATFALYYLIVYVFRFRAALIEVSDASTGVKSYTIDQLVPDLAARILQGTYGSGAMFSITIFSALCGAMAFLSTVSWASHNSRDDTQFAVVVRAIALLAISNMLLLLGFFTQGILSGISFSENWTTNWAAILRNVNIDLSTPSHIFSYGFLVLLPGSVAGYVAMRMAKAQTILRSTAAALIVSLMIVDTLVFANQISSQKEYLFSVLCDIVGGLVGAWIIVRCTAVLGLAEFIADTPNAGLKIGRTRGKSPRRRAR